MRILLNRYANKQGRVFAAYVAVFFPALIYFALESTEYSGPSGAEVPHARNAVLIIVALALAVLQLGFGVESVRSTRRQKAPMYMFAFMNILSAGALWLFLFFYPLGIGLLDVLGF